MDLNIYRTQTLLKAVRLMMPVHSFLRSTFFPGQTTFVTESVLVDYKKSKRKMAPFVAPRAGGITMERQGYSVQEYRAPRIAPQRSITIDDLVIRGMGENILSQQTPASRQADLLGRDLAELDEMITRREEWMVREILFGGKITMKGFVDNALTVTVDQELDYKFENSIVLTSGDLWSADTSTKYEDLKAWRLRVIQKSGIAPKIVIFGQDASTEFVNDAEIQKKLNQFNGTLVIMKPSVVDDAVTYIGVLPELGLELYTYNEWYIDDDGTEKPMIPTDHVLMGHRNMGELLYGAVTQLEGGQFVTIEGTRVPKSWAEEGSDQRLVRLTSSPVPRPDDIDAWLVAKVL
ncbi:major capsid protein [Desulfosporosinus sp. OT]|uniref:major capsid protein n=1 Tax=Desulfosporosinus sp. OT TaxID=913865 RepID=UPI000223A5DB|nr:major capsid protein [Desulfosporosinus sp. OT]EGW39168.1 hypothetical protein DOT_2901 [Desulfosporosinus sp. OT]